MIISVKNCLLSLSVDVVYKYSRGKISKLISWANILFLFEIISSIFWNRTFFVNSSLQETLIILFNPTTVNLDASETINSFFF